MAAMYMMKRGLKQRLKTIGMEYDLNGIGFVIKTSH
jgi:hypothetical protein